MSDINNNKNYDSLRAQCFLVLFKCTSKRRLNIFALLQSSRKRKKKKQILQTIFACEKMPEEVEMESESTTAASSARNKALSKERFYLRYYVGHRGKFGHEFLEFDFRPDGKLRYANNSNYKNDTLIRKECVVSKSVLAELKRIVHDSDILLVRLFLLLLFIGAQQAG